MTEISGMHDSNRPAFKGDIASPPVWQAIFFAALAGGLGWGIRGQYGHETGAMIAGVLVSLTLALLFCPHLPSISVARAIAWGTVAMGIGGSMTYGQTVGLTHDSPLIGHWDALGWGMLGLAIKGGIWIGFAGIFLGMGLSAIRYRPVEILLVMLGLWGLWLCGVLFLNSPFDPEARQLPWLYFSDSWHWEPGAVLKPRREIWGGLLVALVALGGYAGGYRHDRLALNLALWGFLGGALGFPAGQSLQAFRVWNPEMFAATWLAQLQVNWWNMMETLFGAVMGGVLGLGLWLGRKRIAPPPVEEDACFPLAVEIGLLAVHLPLLLAVEFLSIDQVDAVYDLGLAMVVIPVVAIAGGRWWPYLQILPLAVIPIAGKTIRELVYRQDVSSPPVGWLWYAVVPVSLAAALAVWSASRKQTQRPAASFLGRSLIVMTLVYFGLNWAFFRFPWPWESWTYRTANGLCFLAAACGLIALGSWELQKSGRIPSAE